MAPSYPDPLRGAGRAESQAGTYRFDGFEVDLAARELRRAGHVVAVAPQAFAVLVVLLQQRGRAVTRDELKARVWPDVTVSEGSFRQAIWEVRQALGDDATTPRYVRTLRGQGYRFLGEVTSEPDVTSALSAAMSQAQSLVGRVAEVECLSHALHGAMAESGRACLVRGAAGIGKSRLARELVHTARSHGVLCLESCAERDAGVPPFWPWIQLISGFLRDLTPAARAHYEKQAPLAFAMLARGAGGGFGPPAVFTDGPDLQRLYLFEDLTRLFELAARKTPLLLLLEDIHWIDDASTAFLRYFVGALPRTRVLLLLTCRTFLRGQNRPLARALEGVKSGALNEIVELEALDAEQIAELLSSRGVGAPSGEIAAQVQTITGGNPLFALELTRLLASTGAGVPADTLFDGDKTELRSVIRKRLASLPERCLEAAGAASVWGDECGIPQLAALLAESPDETLERVDECLRRGILVPRGEPLCFGFSHPLIAELAYESLPGAERRRLHKEAGLWLEGKAERQVPNLGLLAHHFFCAASTSVARRAVDYAMQSAERAYASTAYEMAIAQCDRALSAAALIEDFAPEQKLSIELSRAEAQGATGERSDATNARFLALAERAIALDAPRLLARAALGYSGQRPAGATMSFDSHIDPVGSSLLERARDRIDAADLELRALLACALSLVLVHSAQRERREELAREALALAGSVGSPALTAHVLSLEAYTCAAPDAYERLCAVVDQTIVLAQTNDLKEVEHCARLARIVNALAIGDTHSAAHDHARAVALAEALGSPRAHGMNELLPTMEAFWRGDIAKAERLSDAAHAVLHSEVHQRQMQLARQTVIALLRGGYAYLPSLVSQLETLLAIYPQAVSCRCTLASANAAQGHVEAARAHFDWVARDDFHAIPEGYQWLAEMLELADCAVRLNDAERARLVHRRLLPFAERLAFYQGRALPAGPVARALSELASVVGDFAGAEHFLAMSRALNQRLGAEMFLQYDALGEVRLLSLSRPFGWRARAAQLLDQITQFAQAIGSRWLEDDAGALRRTCLTYPLSRARTSARKW